MEIFWKSVDFSRLKERKKLNKYKRLGGGDKMKVLIILADNVYLTPYLKFYTSYLEKSNIEYKVIYWDKNDNESIKDVRYIRLLIPAKSKIDKIFGYIRFRKVVINEIKKERYNMLIPLHSIVTFIMWDVFVKKFKEKYIYDIRDYSYEYLKPFRMIQKYIVKNSSINIISSPGYKAFLPEGDYYVLHNIPNMDYKRYQQLNNRVKKTFSLSYIGLIRFMEQNKKIILFFKNDMRFHLNFIGTNANKLKAFCEKNNVKNVTLIDTFDVKDTLKYYMDTDIILNLYGNHTPLLDYALSNKLYFAACLYKPILVCEDTYMEKISQKYEFGFALPMKKENEKELLYQYISNLNREKLIENCDRFMIKVKNEEKMTEYEIDRRIKEMGEK